jgi:hypothetical protein
VNVPASVQALNDEQHRLETARKKIDAARAKGFNVDTWEERYRAMKMEYEAKADQLFQETAK